MKLYKFFNALISFLLTIVSFGQQELSSSIKVRTELESELNLKKVSILLSKLEDIQDLDLPEADKQLLLTQLQSKIQQLLS